MCVNKTTAPQKGLEPQHNLKQSSFFQKQTLESSNPFSTTHLLKMSKQHSQQGDDAAEVMGHFGEKMVKWGLGEI